MIIIGKMVGIPTLKNNKPILIDAFDSSAGVDIAQTRNLFSN